MMALLLYLQQLIFFFTCSHLSGMGDVSDFKKNEEAIFKNAFVQCKAVNFSNIACFVRKRLLTWLPPYPSIQILVFDESFEEHHKQKGLFEKNEFKKPDKL